MRLRLATVGIKRHRTEESGVAVALFKTLFDFLRVLILKKKQFLAVSVMAVTLQMMSNSRRSLPAINAHLLIDQPEVEGTLPIAESL
jgi:hypothetical protein